jgi:hypothetical protein
MMPGNIAINGIRLDTLQLSMFPLVDGVTSLLSYPMSQIQFKLDNGILTLATPALLAVELYRLGLLPQDQSNPLKISIDRRSIGWFTVHDVRYPAKPSSQEKVTFTMLFVSQKSPRRATRAKSRSTAESRRIEEGEGTFVTDITHYLDESGEMAKLPAPARKLASFLTLLIESATSATSAREHNSRIRCRAEGCRGTILTIHSGNQGEIDWRCDACGHNGVIRNWQNTKWNQLPAGRSD